MDITQQIVKQRMQMFLPTSQEPKQRFSSPFSEFDTAKLLEDAYKQIVNARAGNIGDIGPVNRDYLEKIATWLCDKMKKNSLILCGGVGNGKTTTAETVCAVVNNINNCNYWVTTTSAIELSRMPKEQFAELAIRRYLYVDDVGVEPLVAQDFGNKIAPMVDLITIRYPKRLPTIITTNLSIDDIGRRYGERIKDRLIEMCDVLVFETKKSYRK